MARLLGQATPHPPPTDAKPPAAFEAEWDTRREAAIAALKKLRWSAPNAPRPDFRGAILNDAFLSGADLREARMEGANLFKARLQGADLIGARMEGADLSYARMEGADLSYALLTGSSENPNLLFGTNLSASTNLGGALRFVDLKSAIFYAETDWRNVFLDGTVSVPPDFRDQMNDPCQWTTEVLTDAEFFALWRGWLEKTSLAQPPDWERLVPVSWKDVQAIDPPENCVWQTGAMRRDPDAGR